MRRKAMSVFASQGWLVLRTRAATVLRWGLLGALALLLALRGGTPWGTSEFVLMLFALVLSFSAIEPPRNDQVRLFQMRALIFLGLLLAYVAAQVISLPAVLNPIWPVAEDALGTSLPGSIAVSPGQIIWAGVRLTLPYVVFLAGVTLFQFEKDIERLWIGLLGISTLFAVYGISQLLLFPDWLLFEEKLYYRQWLTSTLVNRNSAATLLGLGFIVTLCLIRWTVRSTRARQNREGSVLEVGGVVLPKMLLFLLFAGTVQLLALGLTASRGGLLATVLAVIVAVVLLDFRLLRGRIRNRVVTFAVLGGLMLQALEVFAGKTLYRLETTESDGRLCAFQSTWEAALANLPFGTGLGSFQDVFPGYRDPACGITGIWDKAHNSYLENFLELGLPYVLFLSVGCFFVFRALRQGYTTRGEYRPFVVGGIASTVLVAVHALVDFSLQIPAVACFYALLLASSVTTSLGRSRNR
ncbi:O-antigen ligase family protein [uncultured Roseibium sp.]|uniref:O-antigen ligase family protein n=1 Tax=uncultured Roseibium sp. TaxID=1936171 RepID=UPI0025967061|nr:O-antigen ligase family protein [uncultured Roseibium sp.]